MQQSVAIRTSVASVYNAADEVKLGLGCKEGNVRAVSGNAIHVRTSFCTTKAIALFEPLSPMSWFFHYFWLLMMLIPTKLGTSAKAQIHIVFEVADNGVMLGVMKYQNMQTFQSNF